MPHSLTSRTARLLTAALVSAGLLAAAPLAQAKPATVKVMSRNLYLGADLTPGTTATSLQGLVNAAGGILNQVERLIGDDDFGFD